MMGHVVVKWGKRLPTNVSCSSMGNIFGCLFFVPFEIRWRKGDILFAIYQSGAQLPSPRVALLKDKGLRKYASKLVELYLEKMNMATTRSMYK